MQKMGLILLSHLWVVSTNVFASGFCVGGFYLGYLVGAVIKEVPRNGFILICLLCLMSMSKEVLLSIFFE